MNLKPFRSLLIVLMGACSSSNGAPAPSPAPVLGQPLVIADSLRRELLGQVEAPEGFEAALFAAPPQGMYPTCITAAPGGVLFTCLDPNLSLGEDKGRGRVMRLVDVDGDGTADRSTIFVDSIDSPRGLVFDGETLYVMHPPTLSAFRDTDGDGMADQSETLVEGLGFDLDFRGADHTTNGIEMGIDGWIYVAVGDYGFMKATGRDGAELQNRGGGVVRVRPDGSDLEMYATGTRNIYDLAIDPNLGIFTRDNTNDGQGWDVRLHYLPQGANMGYPTLFHNFPDEALPSLADYGAGAGTGALWVHDPGFPEGFGNTLYTADWTLNQVFRHPLRPKGASYEPEQETFLSIPHPSDMVMDGNSHMYVASLAGGSFTYAGENVGFIVRVSPSDEARSDLPRLDRLDEVQLVDLLTSPSAMRRQWAQQEILRGGAKGKTVRRLEQLIVSEQQPAYARTAAMFTLKQLVGPRSHDTLLRAAENPGVRAMALRALVDRKGELAMVPEAPFVAALSDPDPQVQVQALNGLARLGAEGAASEMIPLMASDDPVVSHTAVQALVELGATEAALKALDTGTPAVVAGALRVLQQMHDPSTVRALIDRVDRARDDTSRRGMLQALARLYNQDATWTGDWWGTQPNTMGPYYEPATWEGSAPIRPVLRDALLSVDDANFAGLAGNFTRNRVLPQGADSLLVALTRSRAPERAEVIRTLIGQTELDAASMPLLARLADKDAALRGAVVRLLVAQSQVSEESVPLLRSAALDRDLAPELRGEALAALSRVPGREGLVAAAEVYAKLNPRPDLQPELERVWRRFVGNRGHGENVGYFVDLAHRADEGERVLGYAVLVQIARVSGHSAEVKNQATGAIDAAWGDPAEAASLVRAIRIMGVEEQYEERLRSYQTR